MTFKESKTIIDALDAVADVSGIADIGAAALVAKCDHETIIKWARVVGLRFVDSLHVNTKIIDC